MLLMHAGRIPILANQIVGCAVVWTPDAGGRGEDLIGWKLPCPIEPIHGAARDDDRDDYRSDVHFHDALLLVARILTGGLL
jgi:hypothetical protein